MSLAIGGMLDSLMRRMTALAAALPGSMRSHPPHGYIVAGLFTAVCHVYVDMTSASFTESRNQRSGMGGPLSLWQLPQLACRYPSAACATLSPGGAYPAGGTGVESFPASFSVV